MTMPAAATEVTLGPVMFNWRPEAWRDFYYRMADEAPITTAYVGEVICSKRTPLFERYYADVAERLERGGKTVVFSTLSEVVHKPDRRSIESICATEGILCEANDASALSHLSGRPHHIGPFVNVYNEATLAFLARRGAENVCLPVELPESAIAVLGRAATEHHVTLEVQVFGRMPLALSARCYHARAHGRTRDSCQYVCEQDPDGMSLETLDRKPFLAINGIQTLSHDYLNLVGDLALLRDHGIARFRLSPHTCDMVEVAAVFRAALDGDIAPDEAISRLEALKLPAPFSNGFLHRSPGWRWTRAGAA
jgi:collagenase-like PrtC family protease